MWQSSNDHTASMIIGSHQVELPRNIIDVSFLHQHHDLQFRLERITAWKTAQYSFFCSAVPRTLVALSLFLCQTETMLYNTTPLKEHSFQRLEEVAKLSLLEVSRGRGLGLYTDSSIISNFKD